MFWQCWKGHAVRDFAFLNIDIVTVSEEAEKNSPAGGRRRAAQPRGYEARIYRDFPYTALDTYFEIMD